jgi:hypothetical protein
MNLFPNLQIHIYTEQETNRNRNRNLSRYPNLSTILQSLLRRGDQQSSIELDDIQVVFGIDTQNNNTNVPTMTGLTMDELNQFTSLFIYNLETSEICTICRNNFTNQEICRKINNCGHLFHQNCVDSWLVRNHTCPMCRHNVIQQT